MRHPLKHHIFRQFFIVNLLTVVAFICLVELMSDDLEKSMVALEVELEEAHYLSQIDGAVQTWQTATTQTTFVPEHVTQFFDLPQIFQGLPVPFSGEIEALDKEYLVSISQLPNGTLYIAQDIVLFEKREAVFITGMIIIGGLLIMISFILTQLSARRIVRPLTHLIQEIANIDPRHRSMRVKEDYPDQELYSIATTFNSYLNVMEDYVKREHTLISMASHELRTPIAVVGGALDVLDERGTMSEKDKKTLGRIRDAADEMSANVEAILKLTKKQPASRQGARVLISESIQSAVQERVSAHPKDQKRISIIPSEIDHEVVGDISLIKMLLRNLIQNALGHTQGNVSLQQNEQGLLILDEGAGLPTNIRLQLSQKPSLPPEQATESGLGLFIVTLICERLNWRIKLNEQTGMGTCFQLYFTATT